VHTVRFEATVFVLRLFRRNPGSILALWLTFAALDTVGAVLLSHFNIYLVFSGKLAVACIGVILTLGDLRDFSGAPAAFRGNRSDQSNNSPLHTTRMRHRTQTLS
jgi:hypothetical protein